MVTHWRPFSTYRHRESAANQRYTTETSGPERPPSRARRFCPTPAAATFHLGNGSIIGHESQHAAVDAQLDETLAI